VWEAAGGDPSLAVREAASEELERAGVDAEPREPRPAAAEPLAPSVPEVRPSSEPAEPDSGLLGRGDVRLGGQIALKQVWRTDTFSDHGANVSVESDVLSFGLSPFFGYFVLSWLELGLELDVAYALDKVRNSDTSGETRRTSWGIDVLPQIRAHLALSDHILFSVAALLGYGYETGSTEADATTAEVTADGLVVGPELGIEIAADRLLIPVWLRFFYRPWSLDDACTPDVTHEAEDFVLAFGTGIHAFF
jgi:hypothetical protein